ncbi:MAG: GIY-YIG nuclease family protein [Patescibacteria group bacterium]
MHKTYCVYIMTNRGNVVLYTGVTGNLVGRVLQHKQRLVPGFTSRYRACKLVYFEEYQYVNDAITREKRIKNWHRQWKINLITKNNPKWEDLAAGWHETLK